LTHFAGSFSLPVRANTGIAMGVGLTISSKYCNTLQHFYTPLVKSVSVAGTPYNPKT